MTAFEHFSRIAHSLQPRAAVVLGSGLGGVAAAFRESATVGFGEIPGLVPPSVHGHGGRLAVGAWNDTPVLVYFGRLHFYEAHPWDLVTRPVRLAAELGARAVILTNAAGGIRADLGPGDLMAIRGHLALLDRASWRSLAANADRRPVYTERLVQTAIASGLPTGVYAALTGPSYETPAEIRALAACGADAVGMSTVKEAEAAAALGLEVAAISCITNRAAGLGNEVLSHAEVIVNARRAESRLAGAIGTLVATVAEMGSGEPRA